VWCFHIPLLSGLTIITLHIEAIRQTNSEVNRPPIKKPRSLHSFPITARRCALW
jgi:hypothetical protein